MKLNDGKLVKVVESRGQGFVTARFEKSIPLTPSRSITRSPSQTRSTVSFEPSGQPETTQQKEKKRRETKRE